MDSRQPGEWNYKDIVLPFLPFYVGIGRNNRIKCHLFPKSLEADTSKNSTIKEIIAETNKPPMILKLYENLSEKQAKEEEKSFISFFGRQDLKNGILTNRTKGGDLFHPEGGPGSRPHAEGVNNYNSKRVDQFDLQGNFIQTWETLAEASKATGIDYRIISNCCVNRRKTGKGFIWQYSLSQREKSPKKSKQKHFLPVFKYDKFGVFIQKYETCVQAEREHRYPLGSISKCLRKKTFKYDSTQWFPNYMGEKINELQELPKKYIGVRKFENSFLMSITVGPRKFSKRFEDEIEAAKIYDCLKLYFCPSCTKLNFPENKNDYSRKDLENLYQKITSRSQKTSAFKWVVKRLKNKFTVSRSKWKEDRVQNKLKFTFTSKSSQNEAAEAADKFYYFYYNCPLQSLNFPEKLRNSTQEDKEKFLKDLVV